MSAEAISELGRRHNRYVVIVEDTLSKILPSNVLEQDSKGNVLVPIGETRFYINGLAHRIAEALISEEQSRG